MRGIVIISDDEKIHTGDDLGLVQERKDIGKPTVQSYSVQVPGRNGLLNLTKGLTGKVTYGNRPLSFQYFGSGSRDHLLELDARMSRFHGETITIVDDDYPDHYYEGEANVATVFNGNYITITLTVDAQPFRLKQTKTVVRHTLSGTKRITLENESIPVIPTITVTSETTVTVNGKTATLSAGTYESEAFELHRGENIVEATGTGTITISYQEGAI